MLRKVVYIIVSVYKLAFICMIVEKKRKRVQKYKMCESVVHNYILHTVCVKMMNGKKKINLLFRYLGRQV